MRRTGQKAPLSVPQKRNPREQLIDFPGQRGKFIGHAVHRKRRLVVGTTISDCRSYAPYGRKALADPAPEQQGEGEQADRGGDKQPEHEARKAVVEGKES